MRTVSILEDSDTVEPTDWCRPLQLIQGFSDGISFRSCYTGTPENNVKWVRAGHVLGPVWFGKTVHDLTVCLGERYEFVRGDIPVTHQLDMKDYNKLS